jgi:single-strand DNA-binding protein
MLNNVILMGRMTADAELKSTPNGKYVTSFSMAVERDYTQNGERQTDFLNLVAWGKTAEFITNYFGKGDMIAVRGSIQTRQYEKDGSKRTATEVMVDKVSFCGGKTEKKEEPKADEYSANGFDMADDPFELPF